MQLLSWWLKRGGAAVAAGVMAAQAFRKFLPLLTEFQLKGVQPKLTNGGIMLPEKSPGKVLQATVGLGSKGKGGEI